jgi:ribosomal protein S18 acetylase RimI-like enzyme
MSHFDVRFQLAAPGDLAAVMLALSNLAKDLGDPFHATPDVLRDALFGPERFAFAVLARGEGDLQGVALCSPGISTTQGQASLYVSDLWVAEKERRKSLGQRLLAAAVVEARKRWNVGSLRLSVYVENTQALEFYRYLGFQVLGGERTALIKEPALTALAGGCA